MDDINYFISYSYFAGMNEGFDNTVLKLKRKIQSIEDIHLIEKRLLETTHHSTIKIICFQIIE